MWKKLSCLAVVAALVLSASAPEHALAKAKPFQKALILVGAKFSFPALLGMLDGLAESGYAPDLIIATCSGTIPTTLYQQIPDAKKRLAYISSSEFHRFLLQLEPNSSIFPLTGALVRKNRKTVPDFFNISILRAPERIDLPSFRDRTFSRKGPAIILVGAKTELTERDVGTSFDNRKLFTEVLFTDPQTATHLQGRSSASAKLPGSRVHDEIEVETGFPVVDAIRVAISEPFLMNPPTFHGTTYTGSYVDLYPYELARSLADEVVATYPTIPDFATNNSIVVSYGFSAENAAKDFVRKPVDHWIDFSDRSEMDDQYGMDYSPGVRSFTLTVPKDRAEYVGRVHSMYDWGKRRGHEAMRTYKGSTSHIRKVKVRDPQTKG